MISNIFTLLAACAFVTADDGFVSFPFTQAPAFANNTKLVVKNAKVRKVPEVLSNAVYEYIVSFSLGGGQLQKASLDTGSADLWVYGAGTGAPYTFNPRHSQYVNDGFKINYVDGSGASGKYYKDTIEWGDIDVEFQFGVARSYSPRVPHGIFGIAQKSNEASLYGEYPNFPAALKNAGKIQSTAYSLYLNEVDSSTGSILFGAIDTSRYTGTLREIPITSDSGFFVDFVVANHRLNGVLDCGTSLTYLPDDVVARIAHSFGATYDYRAEAYRAPRRLPKRGLTFYFDGTPITVPASELWLQISDSDDYYLTILPYSQAQNIVLLGDTFLRSAYVVYDLDSNKVAIAQANWNPGRSQFKLITSKGIPGAQ